MLKLLISAFVLTSAFSIQHSAFRETLRSIGGLPAHIAGSFEEQAACHVTPEGDYLVFDRRAHSVYRVARDGAGGAKKILQIGIEKGRILRPVAFASATDGTFVVADAPGGQERIQIFFYLGIDNASIRAARLSALPAERAVGYRVKDGRRERHDAEDLEGFYGGSNLYASARNFARFANAFALPSQGDKRLVLSPKTPPPASSE